MHIKSSFCLILLMFLTLQAVAQIGPPPIIVAQPIGQSVLNGDTVTFTVVAVSGTSMSFQWYKDGKKIGNNGNIYSKSNVSSDDAGVYNVQVKNASGTVTSSNAVLLVVSSKPAPISACNLSSSGFNLQLTGLTGTKCVIYASSNLVNWTPISTNSIVGGNVNFTDCHATNRTSGFYRAITQ